MICILSFVEEIVILNSCCPDSKAMLSVFLLTEGVEAWKLLVTNLTIESNIGRRDAILLCNMIIQLVLQFLEKRGHRVQNKVPAEQLSL